VKKFCLVLLISLIQVFSQNQFAYPNTTCSTGGECKVGDVGPGGGFIVYVSPTLQTWGRYIEAAPKGWYLNRMDPQQAPFCPERPTYEKGWLLLTGTAIGQGKINSNSLAAICPTGATAVAMAYSGGGLKDWFLPSRGDLNEMYYSKELLVLDRSWYWSSSTTQIHQVASLFVPDGEIKGDVSSSNDFAIRPVRYFVSEADRSALIAKQEADAKAAATKKTTITCVKGKLTKKVTAVKPKCPAGYKVKK
jgi:hypothetical protein